VNNVKKLKNCRSCSGPTEFLLDLGMRPIVNNLQTKPGIAPKFAIEISGCPHCGLVQIINPIDPAKFYTNYANSSTVKREPHIEKLVSRIRTRLPVDAKLIDIGCNDGKFLKALRDCGFKALFGLEPTKNMSDQALLAGFPVFNSYLNYHNSLEVLEEFGKFDCVVIRQVLEHIEHLADFGAAIKNLINPDGLLVIEVPDAQYHFDNSDYALWEEHINEFSFESLSNFLGLHGLKVTERHDAVFAGICLTVFAKPATMDRKTLRSAIHSAESYRYWTQSFGRFKCLVEDQINAVLKRNASVVLYGVGSRALAFLHVTGVIENISFAIDDDPAKQDKYLAGTSIKIRSRAEGLKLLKEDSLLLLGVNGENEENLLAQVRPLLSCEFRSILPPSKYLLDAFSSKG